MIKEASPAPAILDTVGLLRQLSQHPVLPVVIGSPRIILQSPQRTAGFPLKPRRLSAYLFIFMIDGASTHNVDMKTIRLESGQVLLILPGQIHQILSGWQEAREWYKIAFDEQSVALLPQSFAILSNPLQNPIIKLSKEGRERLTHTFASLAQILTGREPHSTSLLLAHLNVLLAEMNDSYFNGKESTIQGKGSMELYLAFTQLVDRDFALHPPVHNLAKDLSVSENRLYAVVRQYAGVSPKEFLLRRIMLEAQRIFYYDRYPVKEVAYRLGFSDPDHFSSLFKKRTGRTVTQFLKDMQLQQGK